MTDKDIKIEHYYALKPVDFSVLERLELSQTVPPQQTPSDLSLNIVLHSPRRTDKRRLCLSFDGVVNFSLVPWSSFVQFPLIEIRAIGDRQWEHLQYEVRETENNTLSFVCRDFDASIEDGEECSSFLCPPQALMTIKPPLAGG